MSTSVLDMSMSLDGYIAEPNDELGHAFGDDGARLHDWFLTPDAEFFRPSEPGRTIDRRLDRDRRGPRGTADCRVRRSLGR